MPNRFNVLLVGAKTYRTLAKAYSATEPNLVTDEEWEYLRTVRTPDGERMFRKESDTALSPAASKRLAVNAGMTTADPVPHITPMSQLLAAAESDNDPDVGGDGSGPHEDGDDGEDDDLDHEDGDEGDDEDDGDDGEDDGEDAPVDGTDGEPQDPADPAAIPAPRQPKTLHIRKSKKVPRKGPRNGPTTGGKAEV